MFNMKTLAVGAGSAVGGVLVWEGGFYVARKINRALQNRKAKKEAAKAADAAQAAADTVAEDVAGEVQA